MLKLKEFTRLSVCGEPLRFMMTSLRGKSLVFRNQLIADCGVYTVANILVYLFGNVNKNNKNKKSHP